jgi:hypothetical protein
LNPTGLNFTGGRVASGACSPLAVYSPYVYVFAHAQQSAFHISSKKKVGGFGNYPAPVLIRGRPIACNARETQFLIRYLDAISFTVDCSRAGFIIPWQAGLPASDAPSSGGKTTDLIRPVWTVRGFSIARAPPESVAPAGRVSGVRTLASRRR